MKKLNEKWLPEQNEGLLIGLISSEKSFRVAWQINTVFEIELVKDENYTIKTDKNEQHTFDVFKFTDELMKREFVLCKNKSGNMQLLPKLKLFDYILIIRGSVNRAEEEEWVLKIVDNNIFSLAKSLDLQQIDIQL